MLDDETEIKELDQAQYLKILWNQLIKYDLAHVNEKNGLGRYH